MPHNKTNTTISGVVNFLKTNLTTYITSMNVENSLSLAIPDGSNANTYSVGFKDIYNMPNYPAVCAYILNDTMPIRALSANRFLMEIPMLISLGFQCGIDDFQTPNYYKDALINCLHSDSSMGCFAHNSHIVDTGAAPATEGSAIGVCYVQISVEKEFDYK